MKKRWSIQQAEKDNNIKSKIQSLISDKEMLMKEAETMLSAENFDKNKFESVEKNLDNIKAELDSYEKEGYDVETKEIVSYINNSNNDNNNNIKTMSQKIVVGNDYTSQFKSLADFANSVHKYSTVGDFDNRLKASVSDSYSGRVDGESFLVPLEYSGEILRVMQSQNSVYQLMKKFGYVKQTAKSSVQVVKSAAPPFSSVTAYWKSELNSTTKTKQDYKPVVVPVNNLYAFSSVSEELLEDEPRFATELTADAAIAIDYKVSDAIINGTGAGQPLGLMNSGSLVTVSKDGGQSANTISRTNVKNMVTSTYRDASSCWLINPSASTQLWDIDASASGTVGSRVYQAGDNIGDGRLGTLAGYPVYESHNTAALSAKGDLVLFTRSGYLAYERSEFKSAVSLGLYFDTAEQAFRWSIRFGGLPVLDAALTSKTKPYSHFAVIEAR